MRTRLLVGLWVFAATSCTKETPSAPETHAAAPVDASVASREVTVTFLVTGSENGYLLPVDGKGGAAQMLGHWRANEPKDAIVLSTGDNANGQSISSYFKGQPTAELMKHMGYAASAFGNRELDWAREQFIANTDAGGFPYLAANLEAKDETGQALKLKPSVMLERNGVKVAVIGLAARKSTWTPMPGRTAGLTLVTDEAALSKAVPEARKAGADAVVVVSDGCLQDVPALLEAHADWKLAFVAGRECGQEVPATVGSTALTYPGSRWHQYARVAVTVDTLKPQAARVTRVDTSTIVLPENAAPEPEAAAKIATWKQKLDEALGGTIGFSQTGLEQESPQMSAWLTSALKDRFKTDLALLNRKGVRQALPAGPITPETVWDLIPFENQVVTVKLTGAQVLAAAENLEARFAGLRSKGDGFVDGKGAAIDPKKTYTLATTDYLYLGGDGFKLHEADPNPTQTGVSWQSALIEWTKAKKSDEKKPLEAMLPK